MSASVEQGSVSLCCPLSVGMRKQQRGAGLDNHHKGNMNCVIYIHFSIFEYEFRRGPEG